MIWPGHSLKKNCLQPLHDIITNSIVLEPIVGVYFLINGNELVYIGQSTDMAKRITAHKNEKRITFNRYSFVECGIDELDIIESLYIHAYRPKKNGKVRNNPEAKYAPVSFLGIVENMRGRK